VFFVRRDREGSPAGQCALHFIRACSTAYDKSSSPHLAHLSDRTMSAPLTPNTSTQETLSNMSQTTSEWEFSPSVLLSPKDIKNLDKKEVQPHLAIMQNGSMVVFRSQGVVTPAEATTVSMALGCTSAPAASKTGKDDTFGQLVSQSRDSSNTFNTSRQGL
jgi:hypothetical protein